MDAQSAETPEIREMPQPQQGYQVNPQGVIDSLIRQNSELTRQIAHLEAFLNEQQEEKMGLQRRVQELELRIINADNAKTVEHNGRVTRSRPKKKANPSA